MKTRVGQWIKGEIATAEKDQCYCGIELGTANIRAGIFTPAGRLLGSAKRSTKLERGPDAVLERIRQCVADAVDECDISPGCVMAASVGVPGGVDATAGTVVSAPDLKWEGVALGPALRKALKVPIHLGRTHGFSALGAYATELPRSPRRVAAIFCGRVTGGALLVEGRFDASSEAVALQERMEESHRRIVKLVGADKMQVLQGKKLRQALRAGEGKTQKLIVEIARLVGEAVLSVVPAVKAEVLVLGGSVIDEARAEFLPVFTEACGVGPVPNATAFPEMVCSNLGDAACMVGAAYWAWQQSRAGTGS